MWHIAGITFHWYGLILGLALAGGWWLSVLQAKRHHLDPTTLDQAFIWIVVGGVLGARLYHVATDWPFYQLHLSQMVAIWQGGLSIIGAVAGGVSGLILFFKLTQKSGQSRIAAYLDLSVFALPMAQAIGRVGNFVNQELYGPPTALPWKIYIDQSHRLPGFFQFAYYQPLFAYEALVLLVFAGGLWYYDAQIHPLKLGTGRLFASYLAFYAVVRFCLEFLRLDTVRLPIGVSVNQVVMLLVLIVSSTFLMRNRYQHEN